MSMPPQNLKRACSRVEEKLGRTLPFKLRGVTINSVLIEAAINVLHDSPEKTLPQNCRNDIRIRTPDGLDRRIKEYLNTDLRTANIISDVLAEAGIVEVIGVANPATGRHVKGTRLLDEWSWGKTAGNNTAAISTSIEHPKQVCAQGPKLAPKTGLDKLGRDEYLNIPDVIKFVNWLDGRLDTPGAFEHRYYLVKARREWQCSCLYEAYENYWWPYKMACPVQGKQVSGAGSHDSIKYLNLLARVLRSSIETNDVDLAQQSALAMLTWGGVLNRNRERIITMGDGICGYFRGVKERLNLSKTRLGTHDGITMNSGFTKLYFLLVDDFIMYDGRVGAALGLLGRLYAEENGLKRIPQAIEFSFGSGKVSPGQLQTVNRRNPSQGKYRLPAFSGHPNRQLNDNIKASWLLYSLADKTASRFALLPRGPLLNEQVTAIQSALFMIGYHVHYDGK